MASRNGHSIFDIITDGWRRTVFDRKYGFGVSIPADFAEAHEIDSGQEVAIHEPEDKEGVLEIHFK